MNQRNNNNRSSFAQANAQPQIAPSEVLAKLRGLMYGMLGWITYQSRCKRRGAFSELLLYLPIYEILQSQDWKITCEYAMKEKKRRGDSRRIDFLIEKDNVVVAIEVKFIKRLQNRGKAEIKSDVEKINSLRNEFPDKDYYPCILLIGVPAKGEDKFNQVDEICHRQYTQHFKTDRTNYCVEVLLVKE